MTRTIETDAVIVGGGPVGLTLAMDLAGRGITVTVLELRQRGEPPSPKCNHVAARSMELFRRLGVAGKLRDAGLPANYPNDVAYRTTMTGPELSRIPIPCRRDRYTSREGPDTWWPTPEPPHRINQIFLEPILFEHAAATPGVMILDRTRFDGLRQDDGGVTARATHLDTDEEVRLRARYLVGCDGGRSAVRREIGVRLSGDPVVQRCQSSFIRAPELLSRLQNAPAWGNVSLNPRRSGTVYAVDGHETFIVHNYLRDDEADFDAVDRDWAIRAILGVDADFKYEVLSREDWFGRRLVADRLRGDRVFLAGDAAHIWVPYGGYGMNAGLADAADLAWLLAARLNGWGADGILDAYERERLPITEQVSRFAMDHAHAMASQRRGVPAEIEDESPAGEAARAAIGKAAYDLNVLQYCCAGLNFGYYYDQSPIIAYDGAPHPPYSMGAFTPSTVPGCRVPHVWLDDGRSLYDALGPEYTLLRLDPSIGVGTLLDSAASRGVPLQLLDVASAEAADVYDARLVLARPDQHVAWRGDQPPVDPLGLIDLIRGYRGQVTGVLRPLLSPVTCNLSPRRLPRVGPERLLVDANAPTGPLRDEHVASLERWADGEQVVFPGYVVDLDLHDPDVRERRAELRRDERRQVAVVVVRRDIRLVGLSHRGHALALNPAVPGQVDDGDVGSMHLQVGPVLLGRDQTLAGRDPGGGGVFDLAQRGRIPGVVFQPLHLERFEQPGDLLHAIGAEVVVDVERDPDLGADRLAERADLALDPVQHPRRHDAVHAVAGRPEARRVDPGRVAGDHDVRLERREAFLHHLAAERGDVVVALERRRAE